MKEKEIERLNVLKEFLSLLLPYEEPFLLHLICLFHQFHFGPLYQQTSQ